MFRRHLLWLGGLAVGVFALVSLPAGAQPAPSLDALRQDAIQKAAAKVAPSIVQIITSGGTEIVGGARGVRKGIGPTSGVIVSADGYIISSAFNFANKPSAITVAIPGQKDSKTAKIIATDQTRMLTLLKVDASGLMVPAFTPKADVKVGQTAIALGRTFSSNVSDDPPSMSVGIVSALNRIWGKAIQTDAKVSPSNYGGPLVDLSGRVQGVIVPASPRAEGETAGFEWFDSGIGFAVPLEDIMAVLPRLKEGKDLKRGVMGVNMKSSDQHGTLPVIGVVLPGSSAEKAGLKPDDQILAIDKKDVHNYAGVQHQLGSKYEGDTVEVKVKRADKEIEPIKVVLGSMVSTAGQPFLGILPVRDDADAGVELRFVYPDSPADKAGLKVGDRIMKVSRVVQPMRPPAVVDVKNRDALLALLDPLTPGNELTLTVKRKGGDKTDTVKVTLGTVPEAIPEKLPEFASKAKAEMKKVDTGLIKKKTANGQDNYWVFVPANYEDNPNVAHAVVVWLHPVGRNKQNDIDDFTDAWEKFCEDNHIILIGPGSPAETGWTPNETDFVMEAVRFVQGAYNTDKRRVVAHGMGRGGEFAYYLGFQKRDTFRAVATTGAALGNNPKERVTNQPLSFFLIAGAKDPLKDAVLDTKKKLTENKYAVSHREIPNFGHQYLTIGVLEELVRWIDSLDRM